MSENARDKGYRLLVDGRLLVRQVDPATGLIMPNAEETTPSTV